MQKFCSRWRSENAAAFLLALLFISQQATASCPIDDFTGHFKIKKVIRCDNTVNFSELISITGTPIQDQVQIRFQVREGSPQSPIQNVEAKLTTDMPEYGSVDCYQEIENDKRSSVLTLWRVPGNFFAGANSLYRDPDGSYSGGTLTCFYELERIKN
ncbi:MAG: hypothetical protein ACAH59_08035 [Pseudobdellovibrionaceae bacterium]